MASFSSNQAAPSRTFRAVTPSDSVDLPAGCRSLYVGGAGDVSLIGDADTEVLFSGVNAGTVLPVGPTRVRATGTTATFIVAMY